jgi:uncharacterized membrane protein
MKAMASITIDRPVDEVFGFVTNVSEMPRWVSGVKSAKLLSKEMGKGARYVLDYMQGWRADTIEIEVTDFEAPRVFGSRSFRGPFQFEGRMELENGADQTKVTNIIEAGPDSVATRLASFLFGPFLRRSFTTRLRDELEQLKSAIQQRGS